MPFNRILCFVWFLQPQRLFLDVYCQMKKKKQILFLRNDMEWGEISEMKHLHQQQPRERVYANVCIETIYLFFLRHFLHFSANYLKCSFCSFCLFVLLLLSMGQRQANAYMRRSTMFHFHSSSAQLLSFIWDSCLLVFIRRMHLLKLNFTTDCITIRYLWVLRSDVSSLIRLFVSNLNSRNTIKYEIANYITERTFVHLIKVHQQSIFIMHLQTDVSKYIFDASSKPFNQRQYHPF